MSLRLPPYGLPAVIPQSGEFIEPFASGNSTAALSTLGRVYWEPVDLAAAIPFAGIAYDQTIAAIGGTSPAVRLGVYADDGTGGRPTGDVLSGTLQTYNPVTAGTGDIYTAWTTYQVLGPGRVWLAFQIVSGSSFSTNVTVATSNVLAMIPVTALGNDNVRSIFFYNGSSSASALPTFQFTGRTGTGPRMGLKAA